MRALSVGCVGVGVESSTYKARLLYVFIYRLFPYTGFVGKSHYTHGGGVNYLCLPPEPEFPDGATGGYQSQSYVYGTEYERHNSPILDQSLHNNDVPCAVCDVTGRTRNLLIPAKTSCPAGWTKEYQGLLMSQHHTQKGSEYICVADGMETLAGGSDGRDGGLLYVVEAVCGSLKCLSAFDE